MSDLFEQYVRALKELEKNKRVVKTKSWQPMPIPLEWGKCHPVKVSPKQARYYDHTNAKENE